MLSANVRFVLIIVAGLPGTGKTTLAGALAKKLHCAHIRIDAIGAALRRAGGRPDPVVITCPRW